MQIIIKPLEENYTTHQVRVTELEQFYSCGFKYKFGEKKFGTEESLHFGTVVHNLVQSYLFNKDKGRKGLDIIARTNPTYCDPISKYFTLMGRYDNLVLAEYKTIAEIHFGEIKLVLEGTIDMICHNEDDNTYSIVDIKTSKVEWKKETEDTKIQKYLYTYLFAQTVGREKIRSFDYAVLTKHKKPRLQVLSMVPDKAHIESFIYSLLSEYSDSLKSNLYRAKKHVGCRFCPLRTTGKCPEWGTKEEVF